MLFANENSVNSNKKKLLFITQTQKPAKNALNAAISQ